MVIDFTASWCVPCRYMEPAINEFAAKYADVEFIKIDVDELMVFHSICFAPRMGFLDSISSDTNMCV